MIAPHFEPIMVHDWSGKTPSSGLGGIFFSCSASPLGLEPTALLSLFNCDEWRHKMHLCKQRAVWSVAEEHQEHPCFSSYLIRQVNLKEDVLRLVLHPR